MHVQKWLAHRHSSQKPQPETAVVFPPLKPPHVNLSLKQVGSSPHVLFCVAVNADEFEWVSEMAVRENPMVLSLQFLLLHKLRRSHLSRTCAPWGFGQNLRLAPLTVWSELRREGWMPKGERVASLKWIDIPVKSKRLTLVYYRLPCFTSLHTYISLACCYRRSLFSTAVTCKTRNHTPH